MKKSNLVSMEESIDVIDNQQTDKKILKKADKLVRQLDGIVSDLDEAKRDALNLLSYNAANDFITEKDADRFQELSDVISAAGSILYALTSRMSRKYVGKGIEPLGNEKRKSLKR